MNIPEMSNMDDKEFDNVSLVSVWAVAGKFKMQAGDNVQRPNGSFEKRGPFYELTKSEARELTNRIYSDLNIDWNEPDMVLEVKPKWVPDKQTTR